MILVEKIVPVARERLVRVREDALLAEVARFLDGKHINLVVVCDNSGAMVGIVTRTDVVRQMALCQGCGCTATAATVMTKDVTFCRPGDLAPRCVVDHERAGSYTHPYRGQGFQHHWALSTLGMPFRFFWRTQHTMSRFCATTSWALDIGEVMSHGQ